MNNYEQIVERINLEAQPGFSRAERYQRFQQALAEALTEWRLNPAEFQIILVAGTNGKGTVAKALEVGLTAAGHSVGLFTSPHLIQITERIRSHRRDLTPEEFVVAYAQVERIADKWRLSHFEILTLMMTFTFFSGRIRSVVETAIVEVGIGGRLDPTRALPHGLSVITRLGLDHQDLLGTTLPEIAAEKLAIIGPGNQVFHAPFAPELGELVSRHRQIGEWHEAESWGFRVEHEGMSPRWIWQTSFGDLPLEMQGSRTVENLNLAWSILRTLASKHQKEMITAIAALSWPCRMEGFTVGGRRLYLSGDHNPQGLASLAEILQNWRYGKVHLIIGIGKNKDRGPMLEICKQIRDHMVTLTLSPFRTAGPEDYKDLPKDWEFRPDPLEAVTDALSKAGEEDLLVVTGSLYLAGFVRAQILAGRFGCATV